MNEKIHLSRVIESLRYPMAVLVVVCHCGFLGGLGVDFQSMPVLSGIQLFFSETLPHVAVPLFLLFSGYLFFKEGQFSKELYARNLKSRLRSLFVPYIIWSTLCFAIAACSGAVSPTPAHYMQGLWDTALWKEGTAFSRTLPGFPVNMPLWFVRDLMILVLVSPAIWYFLKWTRGWGLLLMAAWWFPGHDKFFGFGADSLFYFSLGAFFAMRGTDFVSTARKVAVPGYIAAAVMTAVDFVFMYLGYRKTGTMEFNWIIFNIFVPCLMVAVLNMASALVEKGRAGKLIALSCASFFLYACHILWMEPLRDLLFRLLAPGSEAAVTAFYFGFILLHTATVTALFFLMRRLFPKVTAVLTGGRIESRTY